MIDSTIAKLRTTEKKAYKRVALAYSGGLDSCLCLKVLKNVYEVEEIIPINVDVGQGSAEIEKALINAENLGYSVVQIDAKKHFLDEWISKAIKADGVYGGYPLGTAMTRHMIAKFVVEKAIELNCDAVAEGSTGKSNDQFRFKNVFEFFAPNLKTIQPVREFNLNRNEEVELCEHFGVPYYEAMFGGDDKTAWCRSLASGAITSLAQIPENIWKWYVPAQKAKDEVTEINIGFTKGIPTSLDGINMSLDEIISKLNKVGGENGVGFIDTWEQDIIDVKSREFYEAPAAVVILFAHNNLERVCFPKAEIEFKEVIDRQWAKMVFEGDWFHPLKADLDAFIDNSQKVITGSVKLTLYRGNMKIITCESVNSLYKPEIRSLQSDGFDQRIAGPAAELRALPYRILGMRERLCANL